MKKLVCLFLSVVLLAGTAIGFSVLADGTKQVKNGDAELGNVEGWTAMNGTVENVVLDGNHVIKLTPNAADKGGEYATPQFDIGPAIIKDSANGYDGYGTGKYIVSFKFKAENALSADKYFSPTVCCGVWNKINIAVTTDSEHTNYAIMKSGSDWTTVTATFTVTDEHLATLKTLYDSGNTDAYFMYLRLDGSGNRAFNNGNDLYNYYIDDFTITKEGVITPAEPKALEVVNGDAELGTVEGWTAMNGTVENVELNGNHVIKLTPNAADKGGAYATVQFDMGPAIINDDSMKDSADYYVGGGAGKYNISFKIKAVDPSSISKDRYFSAELRAVDYNGVKPIALSNYVIIPANNASDWTVVERTVTVTEDFLNEAKAAYAAGGADAYKIYVRLDGSGDRAFADGEFAYYIDDFTITKENAVAEPKAREVVNGNAELGTVEGWTAMNGTVENVVLDGNHVIKLTPNNNDGGKYATAQFDLGPAIIKDDSMKGTADYYAGYGAGEYKISFRIKAVDPSSISKNRYFSAELRAVDYNGVKPIALSDYVIISTDNANGWTTVEKTVTVTEEFLKEAKEAYAKGNEDAYKIYLRLDGSGNRAFADGAFAYYLDDFTITCESASVDTGDAAPIAIAAALISAAGAALYVTLKKKEQF